MAKRAKDRAGGQGDAAAMTDAEWVIMEVVWDHEPCAAGTVQESLQESHGWAYSTVKTMMDRMVAKGLLTTRAIRNLQLFSSLVTRQQARGTELSRFLRRAFQGALSPMIQFLVDEERLSAAELRELRQLLKRAEKTP